MADVGGVHKSSKGPKASGGLTDEPQRSWQQEMEARVSALEAQLKPKKSHYLIDKENITNVG